MALLELETIEKLGDPKIQDFLFDVGYKLEQETKYLEHERNLIVLMNIGFINLEKQKWEDAKEIFEKLISYLG